MEWLGVHAQLSSIAARYITYFGYVKVLGGLDDFPRRQPDPSQFAEFIRRDYGHVSEENPSFPALGRAKTDWKRPLLLQSVCPGSRLEPYVGDFNFALQRKVHHVDE